MGLTQEAREFAFDVLRSDDQFILYRRFLPGERSVLALAPATPVPSSQNIARLRHEYSMADELHPAWAARPIELVSRDGGLMLLMEDFGGDPLDEVLQRRRAMEFDFTTLLRIAISLTQAVGGVHRHGLIHKDIKPANVLVDDSGRVRLMGFGIASRVRRRAPRSEPAGADRRHVCLHGAGADRTHEPLDRRAQRSLLARRHALRAAHGRAAVPRLGPDGVDPLPHRPAAAAAERARRRHCPGRSTPSS